jgi:hypothetical protein
MDSIRQPASAELTDKMKSKTTSKLSKTAKDAIHSACFAAINNQDGYQAIRDIINQLTKNPERVVATLSQNKDVVPLFKPSGPKVASAGKSKKNKEDPLQKLAATEEADTPEAYVKIANVFSKPESAKVAAGSLVEATANLEEEDKENKKQTNPIQLIQRAESSLAKVDLSPTVVDNLNAVARALAKVDEQVQRLSNEIAEMNKEKK